MAVVLNITPAEAEKQVFGFKVSELEDAINLSMKPLATTGQCQLRFIQSQKLQPLCIIEIGGPYQQFRLSCDSAVLEAFHRTKQRYGAPRLTDKLRAQGYCFNVKTVAASLRRPGLRAKASHRFSPVSYREHGLSVSESLLKQEFCASGQNRKWAGDITYLRTDDGTAGLRCATDGVVVAQAPGRCDRPHRS